MGITETVAGTENRKISVSATNKRIQPQPHEPPGPEASQITGIDPRGISFVVPPVLPENETGLQMCQAACHYFSPLNRHRVEFYLIILFSNIAGNMGE